jgi:hypothetical protein
LYLPYAGYMASATKLIGTISMAKGLAAVVCKPFTVLRAVTAERPAAGRLKDAVATPCAFVATGPRVLETPCRSALIGLWVLAAPCASVVAGSEVACVAARLAEGLVMSKVTGTPDSGAPRTPNTVAVMSEVVPSMMMPPAMAKVRVGATQLTVKVLLSCPSWSAAYCLAPWLLLVTGAVKGDSLDHQMQ